MRKALLALLLALPGAARAQITAIAPFPGGSDGQLQFNNAFLFDGVPGTLVQGTTVTFVEVRATTAAFGAGAVKSTFTSTGSLFMASGASITLAGAQGWIFTRSSVTASSFWGDCSGCTGIPSTAAITAATIAKLSSVTVNASLFNPQASALFPLGVDPSSVAVKEGGFVKVAELDPSSVTKKGNWSFETAGPIQAASFTGSSGTFSTGTEIFNNQFYKARTSGGVAQNLLGILAAGGDIVRAGDSTGGTGQFQLFTGGELTMYCDRIGIALVDCRFTRQIVGDASLSIAQNIGAGGSITGSTFTATGTGSAFNITATTRTYTPYAHGVTALFESFVATGTGLALDVAGQGKFRATSIPSIQISSMAVLPNVRADTGVFQNIVATGTGLGLDVTGQGKFAGQVKFLETTNPSTIASSKTWAATIQGDTLYVKRIVSTETTSTPFVVIDLASGTINVNGLLVLGSWSGIKWPTGHVSTSPWSNILDASGSGASVTTLNTSSFTFVGRDLPGVVFSNSSTTTLTGFSKGIYLNTTAKIHIRYQGMANADAGTNCYFRLAVDGTALAGPGWIHENGTTASEVVLAGSSDRLAAGLHTVEIIGQRRVSDGGSCNTGPSSDAVKSQLWHASAVTEP